VTLEAFAEQLPMCGDETQCWDHFSSVVLIEAIGESAEQRFPPSGFTQLILHIRTARVVRRRSLCLKN
jgi:hypothetical protein